MQDPNDISDDPFDAILGVIARRDADTDADALRGTVLAKTIGVMRQRRWLKRCMMVGSLLGCYLAGMVTTGILRTDIQAESQTPAVQVVPADMPPHRSTPMPRPHRDSPRPALPKAATRETRTAVTLPTPFESWRNIGDHYFQQSGDIAMATASYAQAIDLATDEERAISPGRDNWLLMALKEARAKERTHGYSVSN
jgi:hypothetical protein